MEENDQYKSLIEDIEHWMTKHGWWRDFDMSDLAEATELESEVFDIVWEIYKTPKIMGDRLNDDVMAFVYRKINGALENIAERYMENCNDPY